MAPYRESGERGMYPESQEILVVDEDDTRRRSIEAILRDEGFPVTSATAGLGALRAINRRDFALVVTAMGLPGTLDGVTTMRQARGKRPRLKFLLVADYPRAPSRVDRDAEDMIAAPFQRWELLGCVFELLQRDVASDSADLARRARGARWAS